MQEREELEGVFEKLQYERNYEKRKRYFVFGCILCVFVTYVFFLVFGNNSWSVLLKLREEKKILEERIKRLQDDNVRLQKVVFELRGLEPTNEE